MEKTYWEDVLLVRKGNVEALGDHVSAAVFDRISRRCEDGGGEWKASVADLADQVWLTPSQTRRALDILLDKGWVSVHREGMDRAGIYSVAPQTLPFDGYRKS